MPQMGGLRKKMPWTAGTMLIGCLAISGAGVPLLAIGFSGFHSKDRILAQTLSFAHENPLHSWIFWVAIVGAAMTAFYMFRLWYMTFAGAPRDEHVYHHAHESPWTMVGPLVVLAVLAVFAGGNLFGTHVGLEPLLEQARPAGLIEGASAGWPAPPVVHPAEHVSHEAAIEHYAGVLAFIFALGGFALATVIYGFEAIHADRIRRRFSLIYAFLVHKWWFDELYWATLVEPVLRLSRAVAKLDTQGIDALADGAARLVAGVAHLDDWIDRLFVDGLVNLTARWTYAAGLRLRAVQTGNVRQYVMLAALGMVVLFILTSFYWNYAIRM
jgi:NADH-quinone oxidoreductase subunit L